tara:strand:+ start:563 stop:1411 length:849 start_codon:yes stop_codon:yes gene_type:complete
MIKYFCIAALSAMFFALMNLLVTYKLNQFEPSLLLFFRGAVSAFILLPVVYKDSRSLLSKKALPIHLRSIAGALAILCTFWTLQNTTALHASFLASLAPIFLMIMVFIAYGNTLNRTQIVGLFFVVFGTLFVAFGFFADAEFIVWMIGLLGAILSALAMLFLKQASMQFSPTLIVFNFSCLFTLFGFFSLKDIEFDFISMTWLCLMGIFSLLGQIFMTISYKQLDPQIANAFGRSLLLWVGGLEFIIFGNLPDRLELIGYFLAAIGLVLIGKSTRVAMVRIK